MKVGILEISWSKILNLQIANIPWVSESCRLL
jgi:hypothetical protein